MSLSHDFWPVGQLSETAPEQIKDRNGVVVLQLCRVCGQAEAEVTPECPGPLTPRQRDLINALVELRLAERVEQQSRQLTRDLEKVTRQKQLECSAARKALIGHDNMVTSDEERELLFRMSELADERLRK